LSKCNAIYKYILYLLFSFYTTFYMWPLKYFIAAT